MGNQLDNDFGSKCMAIPFAAVGNAAKDFKLADIKPINGDNITADDMINAVYFQLLDNGGVTVSGSSRYWDGAKWIDDNGADKSLETYAPGAGVYFYNQSFNMESWECGKVTLQSNGEVIQENVIADLDNDFGSVVLGNPFPTPIKLKDIVPYAIEGELIDYMTYFQKLDNGGVTVDGSSRYWVAGKWIDDGGNDMSEETLAPGEGIYAYNQNYNESDWSCIPVKVRFVAPKF